MDSVDETVIYMSYGFHDSPLSNLVPPVPAQDTHSAAVGEYQSQAITIKVFICKSVQIWSTSGFKHFTFCKCTNLFIIEVQ